MAAASMRAACTPASSAALYTMGVMGWLMLVTLPLGFGAAIVWLITLLIHRSAWGRHNRLAA
jgi:hypothetical protein